MNKLRWAFKCRFCGRVHLIPYSKLRKNSRRYEVYVKCPYSPSFPYYSRALKYKGSSFVLFRGDDEKYKVIESVRVERLSNDE